jgi:hypothetical protein
VSNDQDFDKFEQLTAEAFKLAKDNGLAAVEAAFLASGVAAEVYGVRLHTTVKEIFDNPRAKRARRPR